MFTPMSVLGTWLRSLLSIVLIAGGITLLTLWYNNRERVVVEPVESSTDARRTRIVEWEFGLNRETAFLLGGLALLGFSMGGGWLISPRLLRRSEQMKTDTQEGQLLHVTRSDGTRLEVTAYGPANGEPIVFIHGWGLDNHAWHYARKDLASRFRVIVWDLPGLGKSTKPLDRDWSLEKMAGDLDAVLSLTGEKRAVVVGHSIGGMIALTWCKLFPELIWARLRGLVLVHSTYTNPVHTCSQPGLMAALQKPLLEPLCHLMVWLSPLVRVMNWMSYLNGSCHWSTERDSFSGRETRQQLDFMTKYYCQAPPDVVGHGMLAMLRYDATETLRHIDVPVLVVAAERDRVCTPQASRFMAGAIPGATYVGLANAKHCGFFENHDEFHRTLMTFLSSSSRHSEPVLSGTTVDR